MVYLNNNNINYEISSALTYTSSTNKTLVVIAFIFVGAITGLCVSLITCQVKNKKKKNI